MAAAGKHRGDERWQPDDGALGELCAEVLAHFDQHKPEPASFPQTATQVMDLAEHADADVARLARLVERDQALAAAVLTVANSAMYRRPVPASSLRGAITMLGLRQVANIAVGVACRTLFDVETRVQRDLYPAWWDRLFHSAMTEAFASSFVAMDHGFSPDSVFLAGMFHDIGKPLALRSLSALILQGAVPAMPSDDAIDDVLARVHGAIGAQALGTWGFPEKLMRLCQAQWTAPGGTHDAEAHVIRLTSSLNAVRMGSDTFELQRALNESSAALGLDHDAVLAVAGRVTDFAGQVSVLFGVTDGANEEGYLAWVSSCTAG